MTPIYTFKLGYAIKLTNIEAQKIDKFFWETFKIIMLGFNL